MSRVAVVVVSHSATLAQGVCELAHAMAPQVRIVPAGGTTSLHGESLGTSVERVEAALRFALDGTEGVVILTDLGSSVSTVESVAARVGSELVRVVDAPLVEGCVAAAIRAQMDGSVQEVAAAAVDAGVHFTRSDVTVGGNSELDAAFVEAPAGTVAIASGSARAVATVAHPGGLHARPAALIATLAGTYRSFITIDGVDATSALELMSRHVKLGQTVIVEARGGDAVDAVLTVVKGIEQPDSLG